MKLSQAVDEGYEPEDRTYGQSRSYTLKCIACGKWFKSFWSLDDCDAKGVECKCQECSE